MNFAAEQKSEPIIYSLLVVLLAIPFLADLLVPLGTAVWVLYLFPAALAYFVWRPQVPIAVAGVATVLMIVGYQLASAGIDPEIAQLNRGLGIVTAWIVGLTGYFFVRNKLAVREQRWLQDGQVGLAAAMSGELPLDELGDKVVRFLAEYLDAKVGAVFIKDGHSFQRYATYAVPAGADLPKQFTPGDGLLGQAAKDGRSYLINDVPDGYLYFGSALGKDKPRHLLIGSAKADGEVNAVLELGFVRGASDLHARLLANASESIGIAVRSAKYRMRLQELLAETQQQAEELQTQSEELRATNEELEEQSRSLQESQARLELQQAELERTNAQLEHQTELLEHQRDDLSRAQASLQAQAKELEQASRYKSEFVANMSHELRTPLNSLLIMARLLIDNRGGNLTAEQVKYAQTIETSGNDLLALINDILDISKIEAGRIELKADRVQLRDIAEKLTSSFQGQASEKAIELRAEIAPDAPLELETDRQRLEQILKNFLSNAVKFTDRGEVVLSVHGRREGEVAFTVRDTGIGIPPEQQNVIFEPFRQADGSINRRYGGTGLGLSISRELCRLLGGRIEIESEPGRGSAFTLLMPLSFPAERAAASSQRQIDGVPWHASPVSIRAPAKRNTDSSTNLTRAAQRQIEDDREQLDGISRIILVIEDDVAFARVLLDLAHELGFKCIVTETADDGVIAARQYLPHAVILDIGLPDHTGLTVLDRMKRDVRTRHIPVHVISVSDYTQTALSYGAFGYMLKPVKREELVQALERLETRMVQRMRRVLIVEDDDTQLRSIRALLGSRNVETVGVGSAAACLEQLKTVTFDCMVLDLSLPDASGFDVLEQLSADDTTAFPPVIVYTGRDLQPDEELRLRKYSKSIIIKGAKSPERLLDEVTLFLHQVVSDLPEEQQAMLVRSLNRDAALEGRRILVVEDDVRNVFAVTGIFEPHGAQVEIARNGREALEVLERVAAGSVAPIDIVLMDIMMPEMDGLTATRAIRSRPEWRNLPIIALTAKAMKDDQEQCLAAGANDYLAKPLNIDKLLSLVRVWMPR